MGAVLAQHDDTGKKGQLLDSLQQLLTALATLAARVSCQNRATGMPTVFAAFMVKASC